MKSPLRIAYITNARIPSTKAHGVQIMNMCDSFAKAGQHVELVLPHKKNFIGADPFEFYGVSQRFSVKKVFCLDFGGMTERLAVPLFFIDLVTFMIAAACSPSARHADVIYTRDYLLPFFFSRKRRIIAEIHTVPRNTGLFVRALKRVSRVVVITQGIKNTLIEKGIPAEKIIVAPDAVDLDMFDVRISRDDARKKLGLPIDKKIAMYIGLFDAWKGYITLLDASKELLAENIVVAMIGGDDARIAALRAAYPHVVFLGYRRYLELPENQKAADVLVIPNSARFPISKYFTSPLKLFAYMASGVPIVASDLPSLREVLHENNAFFAAPDDAHALAQAIRNALSHESAARQKAEQASSDVRQYTWDNRAQLILSHVSGLL